MKIAMKMQRAKIVRVERQFDVPKTFQRVQFCKKSLNFRRNRVQYLFHKCFAGSPDHFQSETHLYE